MTIHTEVPVVVVVVVFAATAAAPAAVASAAVAPAAVAPAAAAVTVVGVVDRTSAGTYVSRAIIHLTAKSAAVRSQPTIR